MIHRSRVLPLLGAGLLLAPARAQAPGAGGQEPPGGFGDLKALLALRSTPVVAASKREQSLLESPQAIQVLTADEIRASGVFRLLDLLKLAVGVQVWDETPTRANVTLRGVNPLGNPRTLQVLVDGVPLFNFMASPIDLNGLPVPLEAIDRVEIVRGPSSSLYGANAQMGVISIFTKRARPGWETSARVGFADHGTTRGEAYAARGGDGFNLTVGGSAAATGDFRHPLEVVGRPGARIPQDTSGREQTFLLRPEWTLESDRLWAMFGYGDAGHFDEVSTSATTLAPLTIFPDQAVRREILQAGWSRNWSAALQTEVHLQQKVGRYMTGPLLPLPGNPASLAVWTAILAHDPAFAAPRDFFYDRVRQATLQVNWTPAPEVHAVAGLDTTTIRAIPNLTLGLPEARSERAQGAFASLDWDLADLTLSGGARAEDESLGGHRLSPRLSAVWRLDAGSTLRAGWFTSSRSPTIQEKYSRLGDIPLLAYLQDPSPDLRSEEARSFEVGYRHSAERWSMGLTLFHTRLRDLISLRPTGAVVGGKLVQRYQNNPEAISDQGIELIAEGQPAAGWRLGFTLATSAFKDPVGGEDRQADFSPRATANLWTRWQRGPWSGFVGLQHKGAYTAASPVGTTYAHSDVPATTQLQFNLGWRPLRGLTLSCYGINATHPTADSAPVALSNGFALRYARREVGLQLAWHD
ncbi:MAG TPA: TonB-dependent receptor [Holophagaceae bacterium]|nr:TonB-dependent receptor [Holophagaceae bacterium]